MLGAEAENEPELAKQLFSVFMRRLCTDMRCGPELLHQKSMSAVLRFIMDVVGATNIMDCSDFKPIGKDNQRSATYREQGNEFMRNEPRDLLRALKAYNRALAYAEADSAELASAYGNRSAVCHALKDYELCLENIEMALAVGAGSEQFREKLRLRQQHCREELKLKGDAVKIVEPARVEAFLSYTPNPRIPNIVSGIQLERNGRYGRHLMAKKNFAVGDILMIDEAYATTVEDYKQQYNQCHHCFEPTSILRLRPCPDCVAAMFCSVDCARDAHRRYHRFECPLQDLACIHTEDKMVALRIVCTAISDFGDDLKYLASYLGDLDGNVDAFQLDWNIITPQQLYATIHGLVTTGKTKQDTQTFAIHVIKFLTVAEVLLKHSPPIQKLANTPRKKNLVRRLFVRHAMTTSKNVMVCPTFGRMSVSPLISMMNHSCVPNTMRLSLSGGRTAIVVIQPIMTGDQIYHNYLHINYLFRTNRLEKIYQFWCYCVACAGDYQIVDDAFSDNDEAEPFEYDDWTTLNEVDALLKRFPQPTVGEIATALETMADLLSKYAHLSPERNIGKLSRLYRRGLLSLYSEPLLRQKYAELKL